MSKICTNPDCNIYPMYGCAPHECYWRKPGGFEENKIGTSTIEPFSKWPDNFLAEINPHISVNPQISYGLCGVYYCPECKRGMNEDSELWGKERIMNAISQELSLNKPI